MKRVLFINGYVYLPGEGGIKRTFYLFQMMRELHFDVTFLTSDFNHYAKKGRDTENFFGKYPEYRDCIKFLHMEPYKANISIHRYISGRIFEKKVVSWLKVYGDQYDVVYLTLPAEYIAKSIRNICDDYHIKIIIDVNDLWPDSLKLFIPHEMMYSALTVGIRKNVRDGYANADGIVAVSNEYLEIARRANNRATQYQCVYIGAMLDRFDQGISAFTSDIVKNNEEFWITYIGTLGSSYDFKTVIRAVHRIRIEKNIDIHFKILGQGPGDKAIRTLIKTLNADGIDLLGFMEYGQMAAYLSKSDVCVNCIKQHASQSIINKAADYFASGHPVLNGGPCREMAALVTDAHAGLNYESENSDSLYDTIIYLYEHPDEAAEMGSNARKLAESLFNRRESHMRIIDMIDSI